MKKKLSLLVMVACAALALSGPAWAVTWYTADDSNAQLAVMGLSTGSLGSSALDNPASLAVGAHNFNYGALIFVPTTSGSYTLGQTMAGTDTVMILYDDIFDPQNPGQGALVGNEDTGESAHYAAIGSSVPIDVGGLSTLAPQITYALVAGQVYTLVVSTYSPGSLLVLPFEFYSTGDVIFGTYTGAVDFSGMGNTYNQRSVAGAFDSMGNNLLRNTVLLLGNVNMPELLDSLSGEIYASAPVVLINQDVKLRGRLLRQAQRGPNSVNMLPAYEPGQFITASGLSTGWNFWVEGGGDFSRYDSTRNAGKAEYSGPEILMGSDVFFSDNWQAGIALRYSDKRLEVKSRESRSDIQSYTAGAYISKGFDMGALSTLRFTLGGLISYHDLENRRHVKALQERLTADYNARSWQVFMEAAYTMPVTESLWLEPFVNLAYNSINYSNIHESGGAAALSLKSRSFDNIDAQLGVRAAMPVNNWAALYGELGWRHTFGDIKHETHVSFKNYGGNFDIRGNVMSRDAATVNLGVNLGLEKGVDLAIGYDGTFGDRGQSHGGSARLTFTF